MNPIPFIAVSCAAGAILCFRCVAADPVVIPFVEVEANGTVTTNDVVETEPLYPSSPVSLTIPASPSVSLSFQGLDDNNRSIPPDTHGAVGPNHVLTMLNTQVRVQDRTGVTNIVTKTLFDWWTNAGSFVGPFDPKVVYDPYQNRWIATVCTDAKATNSSLILGVSQGNDPTGGWYYQKIDADTNNVVWIDYPSLGFNKTWIAINVNIFTNVPAPGKTGFRESRTYIFDKANAYTNGTTRTIVYHESGPIAPAITYDNTVATLYAAQVWNTTYSNSTTAGAWRGQLKLYTITGTGASPTYSEVTARPSTAAWSFTNAAANWAPQPNSTVKIANGDGRMQSLVYRGGSLWAAHTAFYPYVNPTRSAIQWWQVTTAGAVEQVGQIHDTSGVEFYAYPSISVNKFGDALLGYSSFSTNQYASANYAFRAFSDPPNTFRSNGVLKAGLGVYYKQGPGGTVNRWGDYSSTMVDPVNDTDFWTVQEYAASPVGDPAVNNSGRWGVWWGKIIASTPANDNFASATTLTGLDGTNNSTLFRATKETSEPNHAGIAGGRSIWFTWTPATNGWVSFDTLQSTNEIDTMIGVYTGSAVNSLTTIASNDDYRFRLRSFVYFNANAGTTYRIAVDAKDTSSEAADAITLVWHESIPPWFVAQPFDDDILAGDTLILTSLAVGQPSPTYQWQTNNINISGATYKNYTNTNPQSATTNAPTSYNYTVMAINTSGSVTSMVARVTVYPSATAILSDYGYLSGDNFKLTVTGIPGYNYIVQASTDFTNWISLHTNTSSFNYTNSVSTNYPYRFFRSIY